jgi:hypothetical protein
MIIYADESKDPNPARLTSHITLAAAAISEDVHKDFNTRLYNLKKRFWKVGQYSDFEIKGRNLLKRNFQAYPRNIEFVKEIISLCRQYGVALFAIVKEYVVGEESESLALDDAVPGLYEKTAQLSILYKYLLERVEAFLLERNRSECAIMVFDEKDPKKDEARAVAFSNLMHRSNFGQSMTHILETALFANSKITPGIQIADLFAYVMNQFFDGRKDLSEFYHELRQLQFVSCDETPENPLKGIRYLAARSRDEGKEKGETAT